MNAVKYTAINFPQINIKKIERYHLTTILLV